MTVMVVFIHTYNFSVYSVSAQKAWGINNFVYYLQTIVDAICVIAVPGFFMISGYLFFRALTRQNLFDKIKRRLKSLLIPYIIWNILYFLFYFCVSNLPILSRYMNEEHYSIFNLSTLVSVFSLYPADSPLWFVNRLILLLLLSPFFLFVFKRHKVVAMCLLTVIFIACTIIGANKYHFLYEMFVFYFPGYIAVNCPQLAEKEYSKKIRLIMLFVWLTYILSVAFFPNFKYSQYGLTLLFESGLFVSFWILINKDKKT